jgi:type II secretory pathway pseudopilin PulG
MKKYSVNNFKPSFTLIEAIFVIVILAFVLIGGFQIISKLYVRNYIAKQTSNFEFTSQQTLDELATLLYYRVPLSTIGYNPDSNVFKYIGDITQSDENYTILEWIGYENDAMQEANLSGFIDLYASDKVNNKIMCRDFNYDFIQTIVNNKFNKSGDLNESAAIVFAGSFDRGEESVLDENEYNNSFGWHGNRADKVFTFKSGSSSNNDALLELNKRPDRIYEKFYLVDSAYAIARGGDININASCISSLNIPQRDLNNTLFLFYNYRPWLNETFCADKNGNNQAGSVSVLSFNVHAFRIRKINSHLVLKITLNKQRADINVTVSKQKVAF